MNRFSLEKALREDAEKKGAEYVFNCRVIDAIGINLETFARFGVQLDEDTRSRLERGRRVREILKQPQYQPIALSEQIAVLVAVNEGVFDHLPISEISEAKTAVRRQAGRELPRLFEKIERGEELERRDIRRMVETAQRALVHSREERDGSGTARDT